MSVVPFDVRLEAAIRTVNGQITQAKNNLSRYALAAKPTTPPIAEVKALTDLLERRHALALQHTYPNAKVYTQITFGPVMDPDDGRAIPLRGAQRRRPDMGVLAGDTLYLVEAKVLNEILDMFPKGSKARSEIEVNLKKSSSFGAQWKTERSLLNRAFKKGAYQAFSGTYVLGAREELLVRTTEKGYGGSHPQVYGNMGDGLPIQSPAPSPSRSIQRIQPIDLQPSPSAIKAAKLNQPVPVARAKPGSAGAATPDTVRAAQSTGGMAIPKTKQSSLPARGVVNPVPAPNRMVDDRGAPTTSSPSYPSTTYKPPRANEPGIIDRWKSTDGGVRASLAQGVAQAFHDFMANGMYRAAQDAAERAADSSWLHNEVAKARHSGQWVLVTAYFAESDVPNPGGVRHLVFRYVDYKAMHEVPGDSPQRMLERLRAYKKPQTYKPADWRPAGGGDRFSMDGWHMVGKDMQVFPADAAEEVVSEPDPFGMGPGRCVIRRLR